MAAGIASLIDHSLLQPNLTDEALRDGCDLARRMRVASVCIKPYAVRLASECLAGSDVAVGTVVGFPHGSGRTETKVYEARLACDDGASELDMVVNIGRVLSRDWDYVEADIRAVVELARERGALTKVIFENDLLPSDEFKIELCRICERVGAEFVKTSTGYGFVKQTDGGYNYRGATEHDVALMRQHCGPAVQVKAAGGIRTYEDAVRIRELGATRIGTTASREIIEGERMALLAQSKPNLE